MADSVLRIGDNNGAGTPTELFLKVFAGEVLTAFAERNVFRERHIVRQISSGKSAQFPVTWKLEASYHTVGNTLEGQAANVSEKVITIDDLLVADFIVANIDEAMNHYDYRSIYSMEAANALARKYDQQVAQVGVLAARASANITGTNPSASPAGTALAGDDSFSTDGPTIVSGIYDAGQAMDENDVPPEDRYFFFRPAQYRLLAQTTGVLDRDIGGRGSIASGVIPEVGGFEIVMTNNLPNSNVTSGPSAYQGDFRKVVGLGMHRSAVGTVQLLDLAMDMEYEPRTQGTFIAAKYAVGHGILRPESAVEMPRATNP